MAEVNLDGNDKTRCFTTQGSVVLGGLLLCIGLNEPGTRPPCSTCRLEVACLCSPPHLLLRSPPLDSLLNVPRTHTCTHTRAHIHTRTNASHGVMLGLGSQSRRILTLTEAPVCEVQCEGHSAPWRAVCDRLAMYYYSITLCHTDKLESDESSEIVVMSCVVLLKSRSKTMNHLVPRCGVWTVARCTSWLVRGWVVQ